MKVGDYITVAFPDGEKRECFIKGINTSHGKDGKSYIDVGVLSIYKPSKFNEEETLKFLEGELDV